MAMPLYTEPSRRRTRRPNPSQRRLLCLVLTVPARGAGVPWGETRKDAAMGVEWQGRSVAAAGAVGQGVDLAPDGTPPCFAGTPADLLNLPRLPGSARCSRPSPRPCGSAWRPARPVSHPPKRFKSSQRRGDNVSSRPSRFVLQNIYIVFTFILTFYRRIPMSGYGLFITDQRRASAHR